MLDHENDEHEQERIRKIIQDAYKLQLKRTMKVSFYLFVLFFAVNGFLFLYRWFRSL